MSKDPLLKRIIIEVGASIVTSVIFYQLGKGADGVAQYELLVQSVTLSVAIIATLLIGEFILLIRGLHQTSEGIDRKIKDYVISNLPNFQHGPQLHDCMPIINLPQDKVMHAWGSATWLIQSEYLAVNYEIIDSAYSAGTADVALQVQNLKARSASISVKKIYIIDSEEELRTRRFQEIAASHKSANVAVKSLLKSKIEDERITFDESRIPSLDFSIFDRRLVFTWHLDEKRRSTGASISQSDDCARIHQALFHALWDIGDDVKD